MFFPVGNMCSFEILLFLVQKEKKGGKVFLICAVISEDLK